MNKLPTFCLLATLAFFYTSCKKNDSSVSDKADHKVPGTNCFVTEVQWKSTFEDNKHYRISYNADNLISKISNLDSSGKEDPDHFSECFYEKGKIQKIVYTHYEMSAGKKIPRKNVRSFEYLDNGLVGTVNIHAHETGTLEELIKCVYQYDDKQEIISRVCKGTMGSVEMKDSTLFLDYENGRPLQVAEYETEKDETGNFTPWKMQNEYKFTYDANSNLIKKEFRRNESMPFETKYSATFDTTQVNPIAEILHIIDEITLSWHENPNMHTRDINKNYRTSLNHYLQYSEKGPDGKRKTVNGISTDTLTATKKDEKGLVTYKEYTHKLNNGRNDFNEQSTISIKYSCK
jgi:hypothetical protein